MRSKDGDPSRRVRSRSRESHTNVSIDYTLSTLAGAQPERARHRRALKRGIDPGVLGARGISCKLHVCNLEIDEIPLVIK